MAKALGALRQRQGMRPAHLYSAPQVSKQWSKVVVVECSSVLLHLPALEGCIRCYTPLQVLQGHQPTIVALLRDVRRAYSLPGQGKAKG